MVIAPGTSLKILTGVPLDNDYAHTIFFNTLDSQTEYFVGMTKYNFAAFTYQRVGAGVVKVPVEADNLYDCNYLMFRNTNFGDKWFYAFITAVEYVNNQCSDVHYEIDVLQTWHFDYTPGICFVERCHTPTDFIGEHIEPEPFDVGEMVFNDYKDIPGYTTLAVIIAIVDTSKAVDGTIYDGVFGGAELWAFNRTDTGGITAKLEEYKQKPDSVLSMYMCPSASIQTPIVDGGVKIKARNIAVSNVITGSTLGNVSATTRLDGYLPHNCKMYTYPYNYLHIDNGSGGTLALRYEFFTQHSPGVQIAGTITQPVSLLLSPINYKGISGIDSLGGLLSANMETLQINNYPMCSWANDSYTAWIAQNALPIAFNAVGTGASVALAGVNPASIPFIANTAIQEVISVLGQGYKASIAADVSRGNLNNAGVQCAMRRQTFWHGRCSVNQYTAKIIDGAFDMFGYSVRQKQAVMRNARPEWTYVKTIGATLTGSVPGDDMKKIIKIFDAGCTWWRDPENVGNYLKPNLATQRG